MYNLRDYTGPSVWRQRDPNARLDETVTATELLLDQYRSIVERNGKIKISVWCAKDRTDRPALFVLDQRGQR